MLTPLDIHNKEFKRGLRGYDIDEVDEFLDEIIKDFESMYKENMELKERMMNQQEKLDKYKEMEDTLQNTMVLAQKLAEEAKRNAEKEAELIIWEARKKGEQIVSQAQDQVTEYTIRIEKMRGYEKQLRIKLKSFLTTQLQLLEQEEPFDRVQFAGPESGRMEAESEQAEVLKENVYMESERD